MIKIFLLLFLSVLLLPVTGSAQFTESDTAAIFYFQAEVEKNLNPEYEKGRKNFFGVAELDIIFNHFFAVLADSAGLNTFPIERLMDLNGRPKSEYPQYNLDIARKRGNAPYYVKAVILFEDAGGNNATTTTTKLSVGKLSGKKTEQRTLLNMISSVEIFEASGTKVKEVTQRTTSTSPVTLASLEGIDVHALGKLALGKSPTEKQNLPDPFVELIRAGANAVAVKLK